MRYVSLFSGIEAATCAWEPLGWEPAAFAEIEPFPCAVLAHRYPGVPNLGDVTNVDWSGYRGAVDLVVGGSPCFVAGTLVYCKDGFKPIEEVVVGDEVLTHLGRFRKVLRTGSTVGDTVLLRGQGSPSIECTPGHPFYSRSKARAWNPLTRNYATTRSEPEWTRADGMGGRFWLNVVPAEAPETPPLAEGRRGAEGYGYIEGFEFTDEFFYVVGRWLGDGWANAHRRRERKNSLMKRVYICCSDRNRETLESALDQAGLHWSETEMRTSYRITISSTQLHDWFVGNFGVGAAGKNLPAWVFGLPERSRESLLRGYLDSDGHATHNGWGSSTISRSLAMGIKMLAGSLGTACSVGLCDHRDVCEIEGRTVNCRPYYTLRGYSASRSAFFEDSGWYGLVRGVAPGREDMMVYNLEVEDDNSYTADGIAVHNCQSFSVAGTREGLRGASGLMLEYIRAVAEIMPRWLVWENVPGALSSTHGEDFGCLLRSMDDLGYGLAWRVLDAQFFGVAQRRRRLFLVGRLGACPPVDVLFEPEGLRWDFEQSGEKRKALAAAAGRGAGGDSECLTPWDVQSRRIYQQDAAWPTLKTDHKPAVAFYQNIRDEVRLFGGDGQTVGALCAEPGAKQQCYVACIPENAVNRPTGGTNGPTAYGEADPSPTLRASKDVSAVCVTQYDEGIAGTLTASYNSGACPDRGANVIAMADDAARAAVDEEMCGTLRSRGQGPVGVDFRHGSVQRSDEPAGTLQAKGSGGYSLNYQPGVLNGAVVRRLTPLECERLQGFPDGWTDVPYKGKDHPPDGPRYKAIGNSMAVPVMRWIGERIQREG